MKYIESSALFKIIKKNKKQYFVTATVALVIGLIISFSIPKSYTSKVMLAPEISDLSGSLSAISDLASSYGINIGSMTRSNDAISTQFYPNVVNSTNFIVKLFNVPLTTDDGKLKTTLVDYLENHQKKAWWAYPMELFKKKEKESMKNVDPFRLTEKQMDMVEYIQECIDCSFDKNTELITIKFTAQDPLISATMVDTISYHLQQFITNYRTNKARNDLEYTKQLFTESKKQYDKSREVYAKFSDANYDVILQSYKLKEAELENEMQIKFNMYNQLSQQLQLARAKVQEKTPVYAVVEPATVPVKKSSPKRLLIILLIEVIALGGLTSKYILSENY